MKVIGAFENKLILLMGWVKLYTGTDLANTKIYIHPRHGHISFCNDGDSAVFQDSSSVHCLP